MPIDKHDKVMEVKRESFKLAQSDSPSAIIYMVLVGMVSQYESLLLEVRRHSQSVKETYERDQRDLDSATLYCHVGTTSSIRDRDLAAVRANMLQEVILSMWSALARFEENRSR